MTDTTEVAMRLRARASQSPIIIGGLCEDLRQAADIIEALAAQPSAGAQGEASCEDQFAQASAIAANIGYVLVPEPDHPDCPHKANGMAKILRDQGADRSRYLNPSNAPATPAQPDTLREDVPGDEVIEQIIYEAFGLGSHSDAAEDATRRIKAHIAAQPDTGDVAALREALERFDEALVNTPDIAERVAKGQQFNAFELCQDDAYSAVFLGPISSKPLSIVEAPYDIAGLIEAAFRVALKSLAALSKPSEDWRESPEANRPRR